MFENQAVIILSGYNFRAVVAFCRWAADHLNNYHVIAQGKTDPVFSTIYKDRVAILRSSQGLSTEDFRSWAKVLRDRYGYRGFVILPSTEYLNRFLIEHRDELESEGFVAPLVSRQLYTRISDKESFARLCESYGLDIPREFRRLPQEIPFVAKPCKYFSSKKVQLIPHLIKSKHDLVKFCEEEDPRDYFFQEYVYGRSFYLLACIDRYATDKDILFSQENLMQQARGGSIILAKASDFHKSSIAKRYTNMLHDIDFFGLIMVEVRLDESRGKYFMIEANPRLWGPMQLAIDNNIDLFGGLLKNYGFATFQTDTTSVLPRYYFWSGGIKKEAQPIAYHNYSSDQFVSNFSDFRNQDVFFRKDTLNLFLQEASMVNYES